eukprot:64568_1
MDEKTSLVQNEQIKQNQIENESILSNISIIDDVVILSDNRKIGYRTCNYNPNDNTQKVVIFFPGAGFGRTHSPFYGKQQEELLLKYSVALIIIERPGYGVSTAQTDQHRTYKSYANDIYYICTKHFRFDKPVYFMAHSAGCPHLLGVAAFYPSLIKQCAIVCPPNPVYGNAPLDRPQEKGARVVQRCCLINCLCCLLCCFKPLVNSWERDPKQFTKFAKKNFGKLPLEAEFFATNEQWITQQEHEFKYAVSECSSGTGTNAMIQDMFLINSIVWPFKVRHINVSKIFVWYGTQDDAAPNGKWYCNTLKNSVERRLEGYGHAAIFIKNKEILEDLISD